jgi:predicted DNA-binding WGR domain protein
MATKEYFEYINDAENSAKFWEYTLDGKKFTVRYGKIGTAGTINEKVLETEAEAQKMAAKLKAEKLKKGYIQK